jgi:hypothetical protein
MMWREEIRKAYRILILKHVTGIVAVLKCVVRTLVFVIVHINNNVDVTAIVKLGLVENGCLCLC